MFSSKAADARSLQRRISKDTSTIEDVWQIIDVGLPDFDEGHIVSCLSRLASFGYHHDASREAPKSFIPFTRTLSQLVDTGNLDPMNVARLASALATTSFTSRLRCRP